MISSGTKGKKGRRLNFYHSGLAPTLRLDPTAALCAQQCRLGFFGRGYRYGGHPTLVTVCLRWLLAGG